MIERPRHQHLHQELQEPLEEPGSTEEWFSAGGDSFWIEGGLDELGEGRNL